MDKKASFDSDGAAFTLKLSFDFSLKSRFCFELDSEVAFEIPAKIRALKSLYVYYSYAIRIIMQSSVGTNYVFLCIKRT
jgi:hypothetical protein